MRQQPLPTLQQQEVTPMLSHNCLRCGLHLGKPSKPTVEWAPDSPYYPGIICLRCTFYLLASMCIGDPFEPGSSLHDVREALDITVANLHRAARKRGVDVPDLEAYMRPDNAVA